jgi:hypothetical protein
VSGVVLVEKVGAFAEELIDFLWTALSALRARCVIHPGEPRWRVMLASPPRIYHQQAP